MFWRVVKNISGGGGAPIYSSAKNCTKLKIRLKGECLAPLRSTTAFIMPTLISEVVVFLLGERSMCFER